MYCQESVIIYSSEIHNPIKTFYVFNSSHKELKMKKLLHNHSPKTDGCSVEKPM